MARILAVCAVLTLLAGCNAPPEPPQPATTVALPSAEEAGQGVLPSVVEAPAPIEAGAEPLPSTATTPDPQPEAAPVVLADQQVIDVVDAAGIQPKPPMCVDLLSPAAFELIVRHETGGRARYDRMYQRPVWPGRASGATIGIGYDLGHATPAVITMDWEQHPQRERLPQASGYTGQAARPVTAAMQDVVTRWPLAEDVFRCTSVIAYYRMTERAFGREAFAKLRPNAQGALVSVVYNRGAGMTGDARREMRTIRDKCIPALDYPCIGSQLRGMVRVWRGTDIEKGMQVRRFDEARLAETP